MDFWELVIQSNTRSLHLIYTVIYIHKVLYEMFNKPFSRRYYPEVFDFFPQISIVPESTPFCKVSLVMVWLENHSTYNLSDMLRFCWWAVHFPVLRNSCLALSPKLQLSQLVFQGGNSFSDLSCGNTYSWDMFILFRYEGSFLTPWFA